MRLRSAASESGKLCGTTVSKIKFVWDGPCTMRKSWMESSGEMLRTSSFTHSRAVPTASSPVRMGS